MAKKETTEEITTRKSVIKKRITRTIQTAKFESLVVGVDYEEEVEWKTLKERQDKSADLEKLLVKDLKESMLIALKSLGLVETNATHKDDTQIETDIATPVGATKVALEDLDKV